MKNERLIFVTNDDGVEAKGFWAAIEVARKFGSVFAVAPRTVQSGKSQSITLYDPLFLDEVRREEGLEVYSFTGTPTDCVKIAFDNLLVGRKVDLVLSGINHGSNSAINVLYSGTMGAAIEGSFYGCPSIGLSVDDHSSDADFEGALKYGEQIVRAILEGDVEAPLCLNINLPAIPASQIKGIKVCRQTKGYWREKFIRNTDPRGREYYWLTGEFINGEPDAQDTDEWAMKNGYVAVVPVQVDMTEYSRLEQMQKLLNI